MSSIGNNPSDMSLNNAADCMSDWDGATDAFSGISGDISGLADGISSAASDVSDIAGDIGSFANDIGSIGSAVQSFLNPGGVSDPSTATPTQGGYSPGTATSPTDTGLPSPTSQDTSGTSGTSGTSSTDTTASDVQDAGLAGEDLSFLQDPSMSVEDKIFTLLFKLQAKDEDQINNKLQGMGTGKTSNLSAKDTQLLQKQTGDLTNLQSMTTQLLQMFHQAKSSTIQNIGR